MSAQKNKNSNQNTQMKSKGSSEKPKKQKKELLSFDEMVRRMQPTSEELKYREEKLKEADFLQKYSKSFKCTRCQYNIKPNVVKEKKVPTHPCLGVIMCQKCCDYYEDGEFSYDSDGEDKYCRWCGRGGTIFSCSKCICGFCAACLKKHFKRGYLKQVREDENWLCFFCNPKPLWDHRLVCSIATNLAENADFETSLSNLKKEISFDSNQSSSSEESIIIRNKEGNSSAKGIYTSSSDDSDSEIPLKRVRFSSTPLGPVSEKSGSILLPNSKSNFLKELNRILVLSKNQMEFGQNWSSKTLEKLKTSANIDENELVKECQKIKWFFSTMSTYFVQFCNSVDKIEKTLGRSDDPKITQSSSSKDQSDYKSILQFLNFIKNQVKTFQDIGLSLPDILEAEVYDSHEVIGLKKKLSPGREFSSQKSSSSPDNDGGHSKNGGSNYTDGSDNAENTEEQGTNNTDKNEDDLSNITMNNSFEKENKNDFIDQDSVNTTPDDINGTETADRREDIREILAILENA